MKRQEMNRIRLYDLQLQTMVWNRRVVLVCRKNNNINWNCISNSHSSRIAEIVYSFKLCPVCYFVSFCSVFLTFLTHVRIRVGSLWIILLYLITKSRLYWVVASTCNRKWFLFYYNCMLHLIKWKRWRIRYSLRYHSLFIFVAMRSKMIILFSSF